MHNRQIKSTLRIATGTLLAGSMTVVGLTAMSELPQESATTEVARPRTGSGSETKVVANTIPLEDFEAIWKRSLRGPLEDPPPPRKPAPKPIVAPRPEPAKIAAPPKPPPKPKLQVQLVGTIIEPGRSMAIFQGSDGAMDVGSVGDELSLDDGGVRVDSIESRGVVVSFKGEASRLEIEKDKSAGREEKKREKKNRRS